MVRLISCRVISFAVSYIIEATAACYCNSHDLVTCASGERPGKAKSPPDTDSSSVMEVAVGSLLSAKFN